MVVPVQVPFDEAFRACLQIDAELFDDVAQADAAGVARLFPEYEARIRTTLAQLAWSYEDYSAAEEAFYAALLG
jgi:hypothetical protein